MWGMNETLDYYDKNAETFAGGTADIEFSAMQDLFLSFLQERLFWILAAAVDGIQDISYKRDTR